MAPISIPTDGLILLHSQDKHRSKEASTESTLLRLDLSQKVTDDLLECLRNQDRVGLQLGKRQFLHFGKSLLSLDISRHSFPSELFRQQNSDDGSLYFSGKFSHKLEVQKAQEATAKTDSALATLENTLKEMQEQKASNETSFVRNKEEMRALHKKQAGSHRPSPLLSASAMHKDRFTTANTRSLPGSPFLGVSSTSRSGPTSAPLVSSFVQREEKIKLDAITIPLLHLLAVGPMTPEAVCKSLHTSKSDCDKILHKYAREARDARMELKEKCYRELDVWKFPYPMQEHRQSAIDHAVQAFDRMRIERRDHLWQLLLPEGERGKGKCLSKLNFNKPVASNGTPQLESRRASSGDDSATEKTMDRGRLHIKSQGPSSRPQSRNQPQKKKPSEKETIPKHGVGKKAPLAGSGLSKTESKFKSSEIIVDSDEEMEAAKVVVTRSDTPAKSQKPETSSGKSQSAKPLSSPPPRKSYHKSNLSTSSISGEAAPNRPRTDTNASSPPTSSTDQESRSTKASSQSSATSSPPSSTDMPQKNNFSPVVSDARRTHARGRSPAKQGGMTNRNIQGLKDGLAPARGASERPSAVKSPLKRKVRPSSSDGHPPAKRQHLSNGTERPVIERKESESESLSSPEKPEHATTRMLERTHRFRRYYDKYKTLHEKINKSKEKNKPELDDLWKMHNRLKEMKKEIWDDYRRLGEPPKIELS